MPSHQSLFKTVTVLALPLLKYRQKLKGVERGRGDRVKSWFRFNSSSFQNFPLLRLLVCAFPWIKCTIDRLRKSASLPGNLDVVVWLGRQGGSLSHSQACLRGDIWMWSGGPAERSGKKKNKKLRRGADELRQGDTSAPTPSLAPRPALAVLEHLRHTTEGKEGKSTGNEG